MLKSTKYNFVSIPTVTRRKQIRQNIGGGMTKKKFFAIQKSPLLLYNSMAL